MKITTLQIALAAPTRIIKGVCYTFEKSNVTAKHSFKRSNSRSWRRHSRALQNIFGDSVMTSSLITEAPYTKNDLT